MPILETIKARYQKLGLSDDVCKANVIVTADIGFANEANMKYLHEEGINAYIPYNQFRSRDPKFENQKAKYGKRHQKPKSKQAKKVIPASAFEFDPTTLSCRRPAGNEISFRGIRDDSNANKRATFEGRLNQCRHCKIKEQCMKNPSSADHRTGAGNQVSFTLTKG